MSPVPKVPQWGDTARLQQLASGLKRENGTYGAVVQRNEPGRPSAAGGAAPAAVVPAEHRDLAARMAAADLARQQWAALAQSSPTPHIMGMLSLAEENFARLAEQFYQQTPNFEP